MHRNRAPAFDFRKRLFLDGGHHYVQAVGAGRIEHQQGERAIPRDQPDPFRRGTHVSTSLPDRPISPIRTSFNPVPESSLAGSWTFAGSMEEIVGIFQSRASADLAVDALRAVGFSPQRIAFMTPEITASELARLPTTDAEAPGIGKALTGYVGGVVGAGGGLALGTAIAGALVPGVGAMVAAGLAAGALLGAGGAAVGTAIGDEMERTLDTGIPRDDLPFYTGLLKQGRSVVVAFADSKELVQAGLLVLEKHGAEDPSDARKRLQEHRSKAA